MTLSTCRLKHIENITYWEFWIFMALRLSNRTDLNSSSSTTPMRNSSSYSSRSASRRSRKSICQREWSGSKRSESSRCEEIGIEKKKPTWADLYTLEKCKTILLHALQSSRFHYSKTSSEQKSSFVKHVRVVGGVESVFA